MPLQHVYFTHVSESNIARLSAVQPVAVVSNLTALTPATSSGTADSFMVGMVLLQPYCLTTSLHASSDLCRTHLVLAGIEYLSILIKLTYLIETLQFAAERSLPALWKISPPPTSHAENQAQLRQPLNCANSSLHWIMERTGLCSSVCTDTLHSVMHSWHRLPPVLKQCILLSKSAQPQIGIAERPMNGAAFSVFSLDFSSLSALRQSFDKQQCVHKEVLFCSCTVPDARRPD